MFVDRQKLERDFLDEITKLGNLLDTIKVGYCMIGDCGLQAYNLKIHQTTDADILIEDKSRNKTVELLFKLGYTVYQMDEKNVKIKKGNNKGDILLTLHFIKEDDKGNYVMSLEHKKLIFPKYIFDTNVSEVKGNLKNKMGKGYFKLAPLEVIYLLKMDIKNPSDINDLDLIRNSGEIDVDRLLSLFELNGWV